jgi:ribosomal protein L37E
MNPRYGFIANDRLYLTRCPKCKLENYALNVSSGFCTWCGYDGNKDEESLLNINKNVEDSI